MSRSRSLCAATLVAVCAGAFAQAQPAPASGKRAEAVPRYVSPLRDYRAFADEPVAPWQAANDTVRRIGGWRAYSREAYQALRAKPAEPAPDRPAPAGDGAHDAHHGARR